MRLTVPTGWLLLALAFALPATAAHPGAPPPKLTVFAAASLKESLDAITSAWRIRTGQHVVVAYAGSNALAQQIEQGAEADVFVSADADWMDYLAERKLIDASTRVDIARNHLVLVAPAYGGAGAVDLKAPGALAAALGEGKLAIGAADTVPAGRYAKQSLESLGQWDGVAARLAPFDDVRGALGSVATGATPLGIVYATDARVEPRVRVVATFPEATHATIDYPAARVAASRNANAAAFVKFLHARQARAILRDAGFAPGH